MIPNDMKDFLDAQDKNFEEASDESWFAIMQIAVECYNNFHGTSFDEYDTVMEWMKTDPVKEET